MNYVRAIEDETIPESIVQNNNVKPPTAQTFPRLPEIGKTPTSFSEQPQQRC